MFSHSFIIEYRKNNKKNKLGLRLQWPFLVRDGLYRNPCVSVCVSVYLSVLRLQNSQRNLYLGQPGAWYWWAAQYKQLVRYTKSVQCTEAGLNSCATVPSKVCALPGNECAKQFRTPARFFVLVCTLACTMNELFNYSNLLWFGFTFPMMVKFWRPPSRLKFLPF